MVAMGPVALWISQKVGSRSLLAASFFNKISWKDCALCQRRRRRLCQLPNEIGKPGKLQESAVMKRVNENKKDNSEKRCQLRVEKAAPL